MPTVRHRAARRERSLLPLVLILLAALVALPAQADEGPDWSRPLEIDGLRLQMTEAELTERFGSRGHQFDGDLRVYGGNLLVRVRDGCVVNLSAAGAPDSHWALVQGGRELARTGQGERTFRAFFGDPAERYVKKDVLVALVYSGSRNDLGVMTLDGQVVGFMLAEPGMLSPSLLDSGYRPADR